MSDEEAPGWDAIDAALAPVVGDAEPQHWATHGEGDEKEGLWGVSAYALDGYWLYVTYGLTELFTKVNDKPDVSGWGNELTLRLARNGDAVAPEWPVRLLARLGEVVYQRKTAFDAGGRMDIPDAGAVVPPALCWADDPVLRPVKGPFGRFGFVTTIGVSRETIAAMRAGTTAAVLETIRPGNPLLVSGGPGLTW
jgi:hypothetical protein